MERLRQQLVALLAQRPWSELDHVEIYSRWCTTKKQQFGDIKRVLVALQRSQFATVAHTDQLVRLLAEFTGNTSADAEQPPALESNVAGDTSVADADETPDVDERTSHRILVEVDTLHRLRDEILDWLTRDAVEKSQFADIPGKLRVDFASKLYNRAGLEYLFDTYLADAGKQETACLMLCDVDQCGQLNDQTGVWWTDQLLIQLAKELDRVCRKERGFDSVARVGGQSVALFLGYTTTETALEISDRWRQRVEAIRFQTGESVQQCTVSVSVIPIDFDRSVADNIELLRHGLDAAKQDGGNVGKFVGDEIVTITSDEQCPEPFDVVVQEIADPALCAAIPLAD